MDTKAARTQLEQLLHELDTTRATLEGEGSGESSEIAHITQHPADVASEVSDNDREVAVIEQTGEQQTEVRAALARLDAGTYGTCVDCGQPIDEARLEFRPEVARCLVDQQKVEARA